MEAITYRDITLKSGETVRATLVSNYSPESLLAIGQQLNIEGRIATVTKIQNIPPEVSTAPHWRAFATFDNEPGRSIEASQDYLSKFVV